MIRKTNAIVGVLLVLQIAVTNFFTSAFAPISLATQSSNAIKFQKTSITAPQKQPGFSILMTSKSGDSDSSNSRMYPGMSQEEIATWMADIPVYAITSKLQLGGIVLLKDPDNTAAAYYFLNKDMAQATLQQMQRSNKNDQSSKDDWQITPFSLGMIWFEVLHKPDDGNNKSDENIAHRLVADTRDLAAAREHVEQFATDGSTSSDKFQKNSFNEIPVFMDLQMRILDPAGSGEGRFPMYLSVRDMVNMCQDFMKTSPDYKATVNIADLNTLVSQMKESSTVNFREALLIAPTPPVPMKGFVVPDEEEASGEEEPYVPSMNTDW